MGATSPSSTAYDPTAAEMFPQLLAIPGAMVFAINPPSLNQPGRKTPVQFVIGGPSYDMLRDWSRAILNGAAENPKLLP